MKSITAKNTRTITTNTDTLSSRRRFSRNYPKEDSWVMLNGALLGSSNLVAGYTTRSTNPNHTSSYSEDPWEQIQLQDWLLQVSTLPTEKSQYN